MMERAIPGLCAARPAWGGGGAAATFSISPTGDDAGPGTEARHPNSPAPGMEMRVSGLSPLCPTSGDYSMPQD